MPFKKDGAEARLDDYRYYIANVMPEARRVAFFEQANIEDPSLPEPPPPLPPVWAETEDHT